MNVQTASILGMGRPLTSLQEYLDAGGGQAVSTARERGSDGVIDEIEASGLRGRGGAGFPTGIKWKTVKNDPCPTKFFVCNAAEGEPGTFKDRWLLRLNPYQVLEGVAVGAYAVGAERAFVAIKSSFEQEIAALERALGEMAEKDLAGDVSIEVVTGPDEYLFGEEKGMLEVIEGNDPLPRVFPPFRIGLFAKSGSANPTVMNNVETLANVPQILRGGADWFRSVGTENSPGTMLFTLVGDVRTEGVYEVPLGTPMRQLLYEIAGGPGEGREFKVVFPGSSHKVVTPDLFDTPLDFDAMKEAGTGLGSAGFVVYDDSTCIIEAALLFARFLHIESCAQCPPCKQNSGEIMEILERFERGEGSNDDIDDALKRCRSVTGGQLCALPTGTALIAGSVFEVFRREFEEHAGQECSSRRDLKMPKLVDFDAKEGRFTFDEKYRHKRPDWTFDSQTGTQASSEAQS